MIKIIYMQSTIKYLIEIFGKHTETELSKALNLGEPKLCSNGTAYILIKEEIEDNNFTPTAA